MTSPSILPISAAQQRPGMAGNHQVLVGFYHIGGDTALWCADATQMSVVGRI
jgi:hypothetical protein